MSFGRTFWLYLARAVILSFAIFLFLRSADPVLRAQSTPGPTTPQGTPGTEGIKSPQKIDSGPPANEDPGSYSTLGQSDLWRYLTSYEFALAVLVLGFGALAIFSGSRTLRGTPVTPDQALRFYGVIVILVGTVLLIVAGLSNNQIAPAIGLFGTLAGYLLGKNSGPPPGVSPGQENDQSK